MGNSLHDDLTLDSIRKEFSQEIRVNPYEKFALLSNPFPTLLGQFYGICVDQEKVKGEFTQKLREFYRDGQTQIMTMIGNTGAGKTNLLRFLEQTLRTWREPNTEKKTITDLFTVYVEQPKGNYLEIHRQIINQFSAMFFAEFFSLVRQHNIDLNELPEKLSGTNPELIRALVHIAEVKPLQLRLEFDSDTKISSPDVQSYRILDYWLQGVKLTAAEKKIIGNVSADVGKSSTVAIKFLSDLVKIFLNVGLFKGVVIFLDEFEEAFSGLTSTMRTQYAQDLRNLFDSHPEGVMFVVATAPVAELLQQISPALQRRLGKGVQIDPIQDEKAALEYARAYIQLGRDEFEKKKNCKVKEIIQNCSDVDKPYYPLTKSQVLEVFNIFKGEYGQENVIPGWFLPQLNHLLYQFVYKDN